VVDVELKVTTQIKSFYKTKWPVPVPARSEVCGRSPADIVGSNTPGAWMSVLSVVCGQVEVSATG